MKSSEHKPDTLADVSYYADDAGGEIKGVLMDHCKALQLELDYFSKENFDATAFKAHIRNLVLNYHPDKKNNLPDNEIKKYNEAFNRIKEAGNYLSDPSCRDPYLERLRINSRFKNQSKSTSKDEGNLKSCFVVNDLHL